MRVATSAPRHRRRSYIDTSAYLCMLLAEERAERLSAHLRTALWFQADERLTRFVTMDTGQEPAARELGLPV